MTASIADSMDGHSWADLPPRDYCHGHGYVYVLGFSDGVTKVGRTLTPAARLNTHRRAASRVGRTIKQWWVSEAHKRYGYTEWLLIDEANRTGRLCERHECFADCSPEALAAFVQQYLAGSLGQLVAKMQRKPSKVPAQ